VSIGFVALWKNNQREYTASPRDEWGTTDDIQAAFGKGRARGNRTYGLYYCRWSSPWQYLTFWVSPNMAAVFDTIADLERVGDFKFADSKHVFGRFIDEPNYLTNGAWEVIPEPNDDEPPPYGLFLMERESGSGRASEARRRQGTPSDLPVAAAKFDVRMYGLFDCRFSTGWDHFTFWTAANPTALHGYLAWLEENNHLRGLDTFAVTGRLDRYFRFGNHLQTSLTWLNDEDVNA
jgi:hypothetical protein